MSKDYYDLCYAQYKQEMNDADVLYQKASLMMIVIPVLTTAVVSLGRLDILDLCFQRVDAFLFCSAAAVACVALATSVFFLFMCVYPREYDTLASMDAWHEWREKYQEYLNGGRQGDAGDQPLDSALQATLCSRLVEAQPKNAKVNEKRRKAFKRSVLMAAVAMLALAVEGLFSLILQVQGV